MPAGEVRDFVDVTVPAGKIFVIEFVSANAQLSSDAQLLLTVFFGPTPHFFAPTLMGFGLSRQAVHWRAIWC